MRARNLKPGFFKNEELGELAFEERLLFAGLWCLADREGFFENRPKRIAAEVFPFDDKITGSRIDKMLCNLMSRHVITLNDTHGYIPTFLKHNNPHPHEAKSTVLEKTKKTLINQCNDMSVTSNDISRQSRADIMTHDSLLMTHDSLLMTHDSPLSDVITSEAKNASLKRFEIFWRAYPKRIGKGAAEKSWKKINPDDDLLQTMLVSIANFEESEQWQKENGQYIPNPATWLNQKRWEDEIKEIAPISKLNHTQRAIIESERRERENG
jgi:hypothetical protein